MPPPFGLTSSSRSSTCASATNCSTTQAKASFTSITAMSSQLRPALVDRANGATVRLERVLVELLPRESPFLGDHLRRDSLRDDLPAVEQLRRQVASV